MNELIKRDYIFKVNDSEYAKELLNALIKYHEKQALPFGYTKMLRKHHGIAFGEQGSGIDGSLRLSDMLKGSYKGFIISTYLTQPYIREIIEPEQFGIFAMVGHFDIWEMS